MHLEQQSRDLAAYLSTPEGRAAFLSFDRRELSDILTPAEAKPEERQLFNNDLTTVLLALSQRQQTEAGGAGPDRTHRVGRDITSSQSQSDLSTRPATVRQVPHPLGESR